MKVRVLGSAAGGGVPQWNCACRNCLAARSGEQPRRSQSSFAVSADGQRWWLINISPDVAQQIEATPSLQPRSGRGTPIAGILLTDANVDHLGGLAVTRQAGDHAFTLYSSATVRDLACAQPAFATFAQPPHRWFTLAAGDSIDLDDVLRADVVAVDGRTPGYAGRAQVVDAVVGYVISDRSNGASALFAPVFARVTEHLATRAADCALSFFDGSFWSDDELGEVGVEKAAQSLGHAPVGGAAGSLVELARIAGPGRRFFAHLNNTNPMLDERSAAYAQVTRAGFEVAADGLEFDL